MEAARPLGPPGGGADQLISARIQFLSGELARYGLVTSWADETHYKTFLIDPASNTYTISGHYPSGESWIDDGLLPEGTDPNNVILSVLMSGGHSTFMIDDQIVYESSTLSTEGGVGFYAMVAPYTKITLSMDNVIIAAP